MNATVTFSYQRRAAANAVLEKFFPGYFALVMATGIVSIAVHNLGWDGIALEMFWLNIVLYLALWVLTLLRFFRFRAQFIADLTHHSRGAAFLTLAAGTCVLGSQFALMTHDARVTEFLWMLGGGLSAVLSYAFFTAVTFREPKPTLQAGISGAWLLVIVASESVSVLGTLVAPMMASTDVVYFVALATFLAGAMLYVFFATLILYRWMFFSMKPERLTPDYWIDMGALAITALAGSLLNEAGTRSHLLTQLSPFLMGSTLFFWATATWWIPLLLLVELWRHARGHVRFNYGPEYWAFVFPLGTYAVATFSIVRAANLALLASVAELFAIFALIAWAVVFIGLLRTLKRLLASIYHA